MIPLSPRPRPAHGILRLAVALLALACSNGTSPQLGRLVLTPPWTTIELNGSVANDTVRASLLDARGVPVRSDSVAWSSSDPTVVRISASGQVRAVGIGRATVRGTLGTMIAEQPITVSDPIFVGAGDIATCLSTKDETTAQLLDTLAGTVFTAGDNDYSDGTPPPSYGVCFDSTWGRHRARLHPAPGEDDRRDNTLDDYYAYFGAAAHPPTGAYSYDLGAWHVVVLNATPAVDTAELSWLRGDLTAHPTLCALVIAHRPRFSSGNTGSSRGMGAVFQTLYDHGVELLLSGNDHDYERFAPQAPDQTVDSAAGVLQLVVGTGGKSHGGINLPLERNSLAQNADTYGVLRLVLHPTSYDWRFVPVPGRTFSDAGQRPCH
jgi:Big-like domain-containing protein